MSKRLLVILFVLSLFVWIAPVTAGGQRWSAWLYDQAHGQLLLLTDVMGGTPQPLNLPLAEGFNTFSRSIAISHDWHYIAYMVSDSGSGDQALIVYDRDTNRLAFNFPMPAHGRITLDLAADENIFNDSSTMLAFGYAFGDEGWEVGTLDLKTMQWGPILRSDASIVTAYRIGSKFVGPVVRQFHGTDITFDMVQLASEGSDHYESYTWNTTTNTLTPDAAYPSLGTATLTTTGETISLTVDSRFPSCNCSPFYSTNALGVYDTATRSTFPFYTTADKLIYFVTFIQNGERVLAHLSGGENSNVDQLVILERSGQVVATMPPEVKVGNVIGWQDGFLYMPILGDSSAAPQLLEVNTRTGANTGKVVWQGAPGSTVLLLQTPGNMQPPKEPFVEWKRLATALIQPTPIPNGPFTIKVGITATIHTTAGDSLRMRSGPGKNFSVLALLSDGTQVTVVEGPQTADGLTWWRVSTPDGATGWVIESIDDNGAKLQTLIPS